MARRVQKALLLFLVVMAAAVLYRQADVTAMQLEDADKFVSDTDDEAASFSEVDADALADKLDEDEEDPQGAADEDEELTDDEDQEAGEAEAQSFLEGDDEEDLNDDDLDLSEMSDEDANAVMEMLNPEERQAFQEMLEEHRNGAQDRSAEL